LGGSGGVGVAGGTFTKIGGGKIYGEDEDGKYMDEKGVEKDLKNTSNNDQGHAAYVAAGGKWRNKTADGKVDLDSEDTPNWSE
jgi:hypothetical protein